MKKVVLTIILCIVVFLSGCSINQKESNIEGATPEESYSSTNDKIGVYMDSDSVVEVKMGTYVDSKQKALCSIKMPTNYTIASIYRDATGQNHTMSETNGKSLSEAVKSDLDNSEQVPETVVLSSRGKIYNNYTFTIVDSKTISIESEKDYAPGGIDIGKGSENIAYVYKTTGQYDVAFVYKINDNWTLYIGNSGELKDNLSLSQIGEELYQLVTPIQ